MATDPNNNITGIREFTTLIHNELEGEGITKEQIRLVLKTAGIELLKENHRGATVSFKPFGSFAPSPWKATRRKLEGVWYEVPAMTRQKFTPSEWALDILNEPEWNLDFALDFSDEVR